MVYLSNQRCTEYRRRDLSLSSYGKGLIPVLNLVNDLCTLSILLRDLIWVGLHSCEPQSSLDNTTHLNNVSIVVASLEINGLKIHYERRDHCLKTL